MHDLGFSLTAGSQLYSDKLNALAQEVVQASIDPGVEDYTREVGVHNVLEMSSFLRILGEQTLQITVRNNGEAITSWVINTTQDEVRNMTGDGRSICKEQHRHHCGPGGLQDPATEVLDRT